MKNPNTNDKRQRAYERKYSADMYKHTLAQIKEGALEQDTRRAHTMAPPASSKTKSTGAQKIVIGSMAAVGVAVAASLLTKNKGAVKTSARKIVKGAKKLKSAKSKIKKAAPIKTAARKVARKTVRKVKSKARALKK